MNSKGFRTVPMMAMMGTYMKARTIHRQIIITVRKPLLFMKHHLRSLAEPGLQKV